MVLAREENYKEDIGMRDTVRGRIEGNVHYKVWRCVLIKKRNELES